MILYNTKNHILNPSNIRIVYINLLECELRGLQDLNNLLKIKELLNKENIKDFMDLFNIIDIDRYGNLYVPSNNIKSKVLRYIEFGGENIKPTHILKNTSLIIDDFIC